MSEGLVNKVAAKLSHNETGGVLGKHLAEAHKGMKKTAMEGVQLDVPKVEMHGPKGIVEQLDQAIGNELHTSATGEITVSRTPGSVEANNHDLISADAERANRILSKSKWSEVDATDQAAVKAMVAFDMRGDKHWGKLATSTNPADVAKFNAELTKRLESRAYFGLAQKRFYDIWSDPPGRPEYVAIRDQLTSSITALNEATLAHDNLDAVVRNTHPLQETAKRQRDQSQKEYDDLLAINKSFSQTPEIEDPPGSGTMIPNPDYDPASGPSKAKQLDDVKTALSAGGSDPEQRAEVYKKLREEVEQAKKSLAAQTEKSPSTLHGKDFIEDQIRSLKADLDPATPGSLQHRLDAMADEKTYVGLLEERDGLGEKMSKAHEKLTKDQEDFAAKDKTYQEAKKAFDDNERKRLKALADRQDAETKLAEAVSSVFTGANKEYQQIWDTAAGTYAKQLVETLEAGRETKKSKEDTKFRRTLDRYYHHDGKEDKKRINDDMDLFTNCNLAEITPPATKMDPVRQILARALHNSGRYPDHIDPTTGNPIPGSGLLEAELFVQNPKNLKFVAENSGLITETLLRHARDAKITFTETQKDKMYDVIETTDWGKLILGTDDMLNKAFEEAKAAGLTEEKNMLTWAMKQKGKVGRFAAFSALIFFFGPLGAGAWIVGQQVMKHKTTYGHDDHSNQLDHEALADTPNPEPDAAIAP